MNCRNCNQPILKNWHFCNKTCRDKYLGSPGLPIKAFRDYKSAASYLGISAKTIRQYEDQYFTIDRSLPNQQIIWKKCKICGHKTPSAKARSNVCTNCTRQKLGIIHAAKQQAQKITKWKVCSICGNKSPSSKCRAKYCKSCTKLGLGHKTGGKKLSKIFTGKGNPNYVHGRTKQSQKDRKNQWYLWGRFVFKKDSYRCILSGRTDELQCHHIIPFSLCIALRFKVENGVVLNRFYHIELHRQLLDLQLLPILSSSVQDVQELAGWFFHQPQVQSLLQLPYQKYDQHELVRVAGQNTHSQRRLSHLHPEFDLASLDHLVQK